MECSPEIRIDWSPTEVPKGLHRRLLLRWRNRLTPGGVMPRLLCNAQNVSISQDAVAPYADVVGATKSSEAPLFFPHALFGSAHLLIIGHDRFPLPAVGLLHIRNQVTCHQPLRFDHSWNMRCWLSRQRNVEKGLEFDFDSTVSIENEVVWQSVSTYLKRGKPQGEVEVVDSGFAAMDDGEILETEFQVPGDIGKQYAKVTGDFNPIHVSRLGARVFGFPRPIAHGMWSVAKTFELIEHTGFPIEHTAIFKGPMFVGSTAKLVSSKDGRFDVMCGRNPRPVIVGKCHT